MILGKDIIKLFKDGWVNSSLKSSTHRLGRVVKREKVSAIKL